MCEGVVEYWGILIVVVELLGKGIGGGELKKGVWLFFCLNFVVSCELWCVWFCCFLSFFCLGVNCSCGGFVVRDFVDVVRIGLIFVCLLIVRLLWVEILFEEFEDLRGFEKLKISFELNEWYYVFYFVIY